MATALTIKSDKDLADLLENIDNPNYYYKNYEGQEFLEWERGISNNKK